MLTKRLRGVHVYSFCEQQVRDSIEWCGQNGFNNIRYAIVSAPVGPDQMHNYEPIDPWGFVGSPIWPPDPDRLECIRRMLCHVERLKRMRELCLAWGVSIVVDMHCWHGMELTEKREHILFLDENRMNALVESWATIFEGLKDEPHIIGYDLINEPGFSSMKEQYMPLIHRLGAKLRAVDTQKLLIVEGKSDDVMQVVNLPLAELRQYAPFLVSGHWYWKISYSGFPGPKTYPSEHLNLEMMKQRLRPLRTWLRENSVQCYVGELGCNVNAPGMLEYLRDVLSLFRYSNFHPMFHHYRALAVPPHGESEAPQSTRVQVVKVVREGL